MAAPQKKARVAVVDWVARGRQWAAWDPCAETRAAVERLLPPEGKEGEEEGDLGALQEMLEKRLQFGTAGLRAEMGPGAARMNDLVVLQTCQGLAQYVQAVFGQQEAQRRGVVIGYDHRRTASGALSSEGFARMAAAVFVQRGFKVYLMGHMVATPLVPFSLTELGCVAGAMVTASHNPKADNGFKVYWENGAQIVPPHDGGIAAAILENLEPEGDFSPEAVERACSGSELCEDPVDRMEAEYLARVVERLHSQSAEVNTSDKAPSICYTAMHGVGLPYVQRVFEAAGLRAPVLVDAQAQPDPEFSTVQFPNPEEKGALDLAQEVSAARDCAVILANDPDADRLAVCEKLGTGDATTFRMFSGNEIGVMLGCYLFEQWRAQNPEGDTSKVAFAASTVSSKMLAGVARAHGAVFRDTLTGFKWIGNACKEMREQGHTVLFSYEEALGYCCGDVVLDKDGVSGAMVFAELVNWLYHGGRTVTDYMNGLYERYGHYVSINSYVKCTDKELIARIFERMRDSGQYWNGSCGDYRISVVRDVTNGYDSSTEDHKGTLPTTPETEMIMYTFENGASITLRTSGTEPKIKYYTEMAGAPGMTAEEVRNNLQAMVDQVVLHNMLQVEENNLEQP